MSTYTIMVKVAGAPDWEAGNVVVPEGATVFDALKKCAEYFDVGDCEHALRAHVGDELQCSARALVKQDEGAMFIVSRACRGGACRGGACRGGGLSPPLPPAAGCRSTRLVCEAFAPRFGLSKRCSKCDHLQESHSSAQPAVSKSTIRAPPRRKRLLSARSPPPTAPQPAASALRFEEGERRETFAPRFGSSSSNRWPTRRSSTQLMTSEPFSPASLPPSPPPPRAKPKRLTGDERREAMDIVNSVMAESEESEEPAAAASNVYVHLKMHPNALLKVIAVAPDVSFADFEAAVRRKAGGAAMQMAFTDAGDRVSLDDDDSLKLFLEARGSRLNLVCTPLSAPTGAAAGETDDALD
jgi:hypothetical protein